MNLKSLASIAVLASMLGCVGVTASSTPAMASISGLSMSGGGNAIVVSPRLKMFWSAVLRAEEGAEAAYEPRLPL
jgi:hypothetical protein